MSRANSFFTQLKHPYYIYAPPYRTSSGGIRALYSLCHALNELGYEAYIANDITENHPTLRCPTLTPEQKQKHIASNRAPIAVYPEVVHGNPFETEVVARWILNKPGHLGGDKQYAPSELLFWWDHWMAPKNESIVQLQLPIIDSNIFYPPLKTHQRSGFCYYANKYLSKYPAISSKLTKNGISLCQNNKLSPAQIAETLRNTEVLYTYEPTSLTLEAMACGCKVAYIDTPYLDEFEWSHTQLFRIPENLIGISSPAEVSTIEIQSQLQAIEKNAWQQIRYFIKTTQDKARKTQKKQLPPPSKNRSSANGNDQLFKLWHSRKTLQEIDGQLLGEHMQSWNATPVINVIIEVLAGEEDLLADSIDSLAAQWLQEWHLTIISERNTPESLLNISQITWITCEKGRHTESINHSLSSLPGEWLLFLEPGCILEPHALIYFLDTINLNPNCKLIYCDEDTLNQEDDHIAPRFKPEFNLELLRSTYYLGACIAVERNEFFACGGKSNFGTPGLYELALKISEKKVDVFRIAHIPEILFHLPKIGLRPIDVNEEHRLLGDHFDRLGINANIEAGLIVGTQIVRYTPVKMPLVSVIIPSKDQPGYLSHCIESLLDTTDYPNLELVIVLHQTTDPDIPSILDELAKLEILEGRLQVLRNDAPFNYAALCNQGAAVARGEHLLFLDNDTEFIQAAWLTRLLGHLEQKDVAAVAPRLSNPDGAFPTLNQTPRILGMRPFAGQMTKPGSNLLEPGYFGNQLVAQDVSALSGSCFLIRAEYFRALNGFDENNTPIHEPILDICLRLRQKNLRLVWTPWVDVVHRDKATRQRLGTQFNEQHAIEATLESEQDFIMRKYLPQLANDPYYHRHLSLQEPYAIEPHAVIDWDTRFHDRLRVLGTPLTGGAGEYRMLAPFRAVQKAGLAQCCQVHPIGRLQQRVLNPIELARAAPDTLIIQQAIDNLQILRMRQYRKYNPDIFVAYSVDDIIGNLPKKHYLYNFQIREGKSRLREALSLSDRLIASTEPIAEFCKDMIEDIVIVPNCIEGERWLPLVPARNHGKRPRVGWAGAQQHLGDLEMIKEVVEATHKEVDWIFMGMCPDSLKPFVHEEHPFVPLNQYPEKLATLALDLAIAPLEQVIFNEGKSNLRLLEYGMMGWPVVCSNVYPYRTNNAPVTRVENITEQWVDAIRERVFDREAAAKEGEALRQWVLKHYLLENNLEPWLSAFSRN